MSNQPIFCQCCLEAGLGNVLPGSKECPHFSQYSPNDVWLSISGALLERPVVDNYYQKWYIQNPIPYPSHRAFEDVKWESNSSNNTFKLPTHAGERLHFEESYEEDIFCKVHLDVVDPDPPVTLPGLANHFLEVLGRSSNRSRKQMVGRSKYSDDDPLFIDPRHQQTALEAARNVQSRGFSNRGGIQG